MRVLIFLLDCLQGSSALLRFLKTGPVRAAGFKRGAWRPRDREASKAGTVWFHAASLGELEMVRPLIDDLLSEGRTVGVSVFSESGLSGLRDLRGLCVYAGLSPRESEWGPMFDFFRVEKVILSKYDFWPGLIEAAASRSIRFDVVNARPGRSLGWTRWMLWTRRIFRISGRSMPRFRLFCNPGVDSRELSRMLPGAEVAGGVDPRWERVARRIEAFAGGLTPKVDRVRFWADQWRGLPGPKVLVGSAWLSDLDRILPAFSGVTGTLIVAPHRLDDAHLEPMRARLEQFLPGRFVLVKEMGILTELYAALHSTQTAHEPAVNRAVVGGGFGEGIHSTIEPAASGLPVACGPRRVGDFSEALDLRKRGVLTVCETSGDFRRWLLEPSLPVSDSNWIAGQRALYRTLLEDCRRIR